MFFKLLFIDQIADSVTHCVTCSDKKKPLRRWRTVNASLMGYSGYYSTEHSAKITTVANLSSRTVDTWSWNLPLSPPCRRQTHPIMVEMRAGRPPAEWLARPDRSSWTAFSRNTQRRGRRPSADRPRGRSRHENPRVTYFERKTMPLVKDELHGISDFTPFQEWKIEKAQIRPRK